MSPIIIMDQSHSRLTGRGSCDTFGQLRGLCLALLLATAGQVAALAAGYAASPRFWVIVPAQLLAVGFGATIGLHWGPRPGIQAMPSAAPDVRSEPSDPPEARTSMKAPPLCPDPALEVAVAPAG
jgi:hypothetical protein